MKRLALAWRVLVDPTRETPLVASIRSALRTG